MQFRKTFISILSFLLIATMAKSQDRSIGQWRSHLPYNRVVCTATDGSMLYVAGQQSFFTYDLVNKEIITYSKVEGMADVGLSYVSADKSSGLAIIAYVNSNIDLFQDGTFYNIPDIKNKSITGDKKIYHIHTENGYAYLSTGIGIVVINLSKKEIKETYTFSKNGQAVTTQALTSDGNYFYVATKNGLYKTAKSNPAIQSSSTWKLLDSTRVLSYITRSNGKVFVSGTDSMFVIDNDTLQFIYQSGKQTKHIDSIGLGVSISKYSSIGGGLIYEMDMNYNLRDSIISSFPVQTTQTSDGAIWISDINWGLRTKEIGVTPSGPVYQGTFDIIANNNKVYVAHGSYDDKWNINLNNNGVSVFENNKWSTFNSLNYIPFGGMYDAIYLAQDPVDNTLYVASLVNGLYYKKEDNTGGVYKEGIFEPNIVDPSTYRVSGVSFDQYNNLWATQINAPHELVVKSHEDGNWYKYHVEENRGYWQYGAAGVIVDDYNQKWYFGPVGGGVIVYDDNNTLPVLSDDNYRWLQLGKGQGNLPDNNVNCLVNDKKGTIWIGTANGIGIINCPDQVINRQCETEIRVVQYDQFAGNLFQGQNVKTIAVDGANRKWIGTNNGVWLISDDANKILNRFTVDNSPLPSNVIQVIKIDPVTGDVYIGTDQGLISYRSTATEGGTANINVKAYPNPVPSGYAGTIAIKGFVENADVRITDIAGQLIFRTKALGGQAIWNGLDYTGRRPQSGVYLIFATNNTGTETFAGKMVFIK